MEFWDRKSAINSSSRPACNNRILGLLSHIAARWSWQKLTFYRAEPDKTWHFIALTWKNLKIFQALAIITTYYQHSSWRLKLFQALKDVIIFYPLHLSGQSTRVNSIRVQFIQALKYGVQLAPPFQFSWFSTCAILTLVQRAIWAVTKTVLKKWVPPALCF